MDIKTDFKTKMMNFINTPLQCKKISNQ